MSKKAFERAQKILNTFVILMMLFQPVSAPGLMVAIAQDTGTETVDSAPAPAPEPAPAPKEEPVAEPQTPVADGVAETVDNVVETVGDAVAPTEETAEPATDGTETTETPADTGVPTLEEQPVDGAITPEAAAIVVPVEAPVVELAPVLQEQKKNDPDISTDKNNYKPGEEAIITGKNFEPNSTITLKITDPKGTDESHNVTIDGDGNFTYKYTVTGFKGEYLIEAFAGSVLLASTTFKDPGNPSADLDQYANTDNDWVNGNLGSSKAHYFEGDSVPYRMRFDNLSLSSHTITIEWDTTKSGKHALDYLTSFDRTVGSADPCDGVAGCGSFTTFAIPADPQVTGAGVTPIAGNFTLFGGTITGVSAYSYSNGTGFTGDKSASITITFTATQANPVLAWGGHISDRDDWGADNAAITIPGSPYHTRLIDLDGSGGNQDRSLSADAVVFPASITIIKQATPEGSTSFPFTASPSPLANFSLVDDGTSANTRLFSNILNFQAYDIAETVPAGWSLTGIVCGVTSSNGGSQTVNLPGVNIDIKEGENVTCTFSDTRNQVAPTVTTDIHNANHDIITSAAAGSTVHDSATVSGSLGTPTGNVTFSFFNNGTCSNTPAATSGTFALSSGSVDATTFTQGPLNTGSYSFKAHYAGDSNYLAADGPCEPLTINKLTPSIATVPSAGGIVGIQIHDTANVTGGLNPSGTVTFNLYGVNDATCASSAIFTDTQSLSGGSATSGNYTTAATGTYHWKATYNGDSNNNSVTSPCADEPVTTGKATPTLTTDIHNAAHTIVTSVPAGSTVHDSASISGGQNPSGTVDFTFYTSSDCTTGGSAAGTGIALDSGVAHPSSNEGPLNAGAYSFRAHYNGDANNNAVNSACEPLTVTQLTPTVTTEIHFNGENIVTGVLPLGTTVHDKATVAGAFGTPTGNVDFTFFNNGTCDSTGSAAGTGIALDSGVAHPSSSEGPLTTGSYSFRAHYNGDNNYAAANSECEPLSVEKAQLAISTDIHNASEQVVTSVPLGSTVHDKATVSGIVGSIIPSNQVTFKFFNNGTCAGDGTSAGSVALSGNIAHPSNNEGPLEAGNYSFQATIADDSNYTGVVGPCEPLTVNEADTTVTTHVHNTAHEDITNSSVALGSIVHDNASVGGKVGDTDITGNITYHFYNNGTCNGTPASDQTVTVGTESSATSALAAGSYSYKADYSGDDNYNSSNGICEPFTINKAQLTVDTIVHNASHENVTNSNVSLGSILHDTAVVSGGVNGFALPNVSFTLTSNYNGTCANGSAVGNDGTDGGAVKSANSSALSAGAYAYRAVVAGNDNYIGSTGSCEPVNVNKAAIDLSTELHKSGEDVVNVGSSVPLGTSIHDKATVSGTVDSLPITGNVTFTFYENGICDGSGISAGTINLINDSAHPSANQGPLEAGNYSFKAHYNGNSNYDEKDSACENFTVSKSDLTVSTQIHNENHDVITSAALGSTVHDRAVVAGTVGTFDPANPVIFTFYNNGTCDGDGAGAGSVVLSGGVAHPSDSEGPLAAGSYSFKASIAGDDNYNGDNSDCEPLTINKEQLSVTTAVHDASHTDKTDSSVKAGSVMHDTATISGGVQGFILPDVSFTLTSGYTETCDDGSAVANNGTEGSAIKSADSSSLTTGAYAYRATVAGNDNYIGANSACEPFGVVNARIGITPNTSTNEVDNSHDFTVKVEEDTGSGFTPVSGAIANAIATPTPDGGLDVSDCNDGTDVNGECIVIINSSVAGVFSIIARSTITVNGVEFKLQTNGSGDNSAPATKIYVDAKINLTPASATNNINSPHTITATVMEDPGTGSVAAEGELVTFSLLNNTANAIFVGGVNTCTTDSSGVCTVQINTSTPGAVDIHGTVDVSVGGLILTRTTDSTHGSSADAAKTYVAGKIIIEKQTLPDGATQLFTFDPSWSETNFTLADNGQQDSGWLAPGPYSIEELISLSPGWIQTGVDCISSLIQREPSSIVPNNISLLAGEIITCTFTNTFTPPALTIEKFNEQWDDTLKPGDIVDYNIIVRAPEGNLTDVNDVVVKDLLPDGFTFVSGSATQGSLTGAYASPGTWSLGNMAPGDSATITYKAQIGGSQDPGTYKDLAWAEGLDDNKGQVLADSTVAATRPADDPDTGVITDIFVGTQIALATPISETVDLAERTKTDTDTKHKTRRVLGAALPATGASPIGPMVALILLIVGFNLVMEGRKRAKTNNQILNGTLMKMLIVAVMSGVLIFSGNITKAATPDPNISVRIEDPKSPTDTGTFGIGFVTLDIKGRDLSVQCYEETLGAITTKYVHKDGGNSGNCAIDSFGDGSYKFYVIASTGGDSTESNHVTVDINTAAPSVPLNYHRDNDSCTVTFTTANDGLTSSVELYRSTSIDFTADDSTYVGTLAIVPNTNGTIIDPKGNCGDYYYAIRAVSASGAGSDFVGDEKVTVHHRTRTRTRTITTHPAAAGAIAVAGGGAAGGTVAGEETTPTTGGEEPGSVLGEESTPEGVKGAETGIVGGTGSFIKNHPFWSTLIGLGILGLIYYAIRAIRSRKKGANNKNIK